MLYNWVYLILFYVFDENYFMYFLILVELKLILSKKCIFNKNDIFFYLEKWKRMKMKVVVDFVMMNCYGNF